MPIKKIVLIDDEKLIRITTSMLLKQNGFEIETAGNGEEGLKTVREYNPDLILLDVMMPGLSGWDVLRELRKDAATREIRIIIFTACDVPVPDDILAESGGYTILKKPFQIRQLLSIISPKGTGNG